MPHRRIPREHRVRGWRELFTFHVLSSPPLLFLQSLATAALHEGDRDEDIEEFPLSLELSFCFLPK